MQKTQCSGEFALPGEADTINCASGIGKTVILLLSQIDTVLKCSQLLPAMHSAASPERLPCSVEPILGGPQQTSGNKKRLLPPCGQNAILLLGQVGPRHGWFCAQFLRLGLLSKARTRVTGAVHAPGRQP